MKDLRDIKDLPIRDVKPTNKLEDGEIHFATLLTITSSRSSNSIMKKIDGRGSPSDDTGASSGEERG